MKLKGTHVSKIIGILVHKTFRILYGRNFTANIGQVDLCSNTNLVIMTFVKLKKEQVFWLENQKEMKTFSRQLCQCDQKKR